MIKERLPKWGPKTPRPEVDPREGLRDLEGELVGDYDTTTIPLHFLEQALASGEDPIRISIPGQSVTHTLSRSFAETVTAVRRSRMQYADV